MLHKMTRDIDQRAQDTRDLLRVKIQLCKYVRGKVEFHFYFISLVPIIGAIAMSS